MTKIKKQILKGLKAPVIQFMIIGAIFFLFDTYILSADYNENSLENSVSLSVGEVKSMEQIWTSKWQRPPTDIEMEGMINQKVEEAILFKEAAKLGLDKNDDIIRQRMAQKLQFLTNNLAKPDSIDDEELEIYFKENIKNYTTPSTLTFVQLFVDPKTHGDNLEEEVKIRLSKLKNIDITSSKINGYGDSFLLQNYFPEKSELELTKLFGGKFAHDAFALGIDKWYAIQSQYGTHLVYVSYISPEIIPALETIKDLVSQDLQIEKQIKINNTYIDGILSRYEVIVEN